MKQLHVYNDDSPNRTRCGEKTADVGRDKIAASGVKATLAALDKGEHPLSGIANVCKKCLKGLALVLVLALVGCRAMSLEGSRDAGDTAGNVAAAVVPPGLGEAAVPVIKALGEFASREAERRAEGKTEDELGLLTKLLAGLGAAGAAFVAVRGRGTQKNADELYDKSAALGERVAALEKSK